jgi:predicted neutral ceramidase superfamily lipid hydrolase
MLYSFVWLERVFDYYHRCLYYFIISMKIWDIIRKSLLSLVLAWIVVYLLWLWTNWAIIVNEWNNILAYVLLLVVFGYVFINYVVYTFHIKWNRVTLAILGLLLLVVWDTTLINDAANTVYIGDLTKILWVLFLIAGPAKLFLSKKKQEEIKESKMEVIEA